MGEQKSGHPKACEMRLLSYNIHKGIGGRDRRYRLERIFDVIVDGPSAPLALPEAAALAARPCFSGGCAAAACAARRAAAMKLDEDTGSFGAEGISLIAFSDAAMRSEGVAGRPPGRVPGSSG